MKTYQQLSENQKKIYDALMRFFIKGNFEKKDYLTAIGVFLNYMKNERNR